MFRSELQNVNNVLVCFVAKVAVNIELKRFDSETKMTEVKEIFDGLVFDVDKLQM
jgi:hypothetical protein